MVVAGLLMILVAAGVAGAVRPSWGTPLVVAIGGGVALAALVILRGGPGAEGWGDFGFELAIATVVLASAAAACGVAIRRSF